MKRLVLLFSLAACDTPGLDFEGIEPTRIDVSGTLFDVRIRGQMAEAIRLTPDPAPRWLSVGAKAGFAIEKVSGCKISRLGGDTAVVTARIGCPDALVPPALPHQLHYVCDIGPPFTIHSTSIGVTEMTCDRVLD
jgi:hypothetical protein